MPVRRHRTDDLGNDSKFHGRITGQGASADRVSLMKKLVGRDAGLPEGRFNRIFEIRIICPDTIIFEGLRGNLWVDFSEERL